MVAISYLPLPWVCAVVAILAYCTSLRPGCGQWWLYQHIVSPSALGVCSGDYISILYLPLPWVCPVVTISAYCISLCPGCVQWWLYRISLCPGCVQWWLYWHIVPPSALGVCSGGYIGILYLPLPWVCAVVAISAYCTSLCPGCVQWWLYWHIVSLSTPGMCLTVVVAVSAH